MVRDQAALLTFSSEIFQTCRAERQRTDQMDSQLVYNMSFGPGFVTSGLLCPSRSIAIRSAGRKTKIEQNSFAGEKHLANDSLNRNGIIGS